MISPERLTEIEADALAHQRGGMFHHSMERDIPELLAELRRLYAQLPVSAAPSPSRDFEVLLAELERLGGSTSVCFSSPAHPRIHGRGGLAYARHGDPLVVSAEVQAGRARKTLRAETTYSRASLSALCRAGAILNHYGHLFGPEEQNELVRAACAAIGRHRAPAP